MKDSYILNTSYSNFLREARKRFEMSYRVCANAPKEEFEELLQIALNGCMRYVADAAKYCILVGATGLSVPDIKQEKEEV